MTNFSSNTLFVFDIETIPDDMAANNLLDNDFANIQEKRDALKNYHLEITDGKNDFLRQPFHRVIAISFLIATIECAHDGKEIYTFKELRSGGNLQSGEVDLIKGFFATLEKFHPKIVSFNGRTFDIPVLKYRAMKYGISAPNFHNIGNKFENYNHRYSLNMHCDLIDALSDFGASAKIKLNEVCAIFDYPGKFGANGADVLTMYDEGKLLDIRNYCESDVINTYLVYLRYSLHTGKITLKSYNQAIEDLLLYVDTIQLPHLNAFKEAWCKSNANKFYL